MPNYINTNITTDVSSSAEHIIKYVSDSISTATSQINSLILQVSTLQQSLVNSINSQSQVNSINKPTINSKQTTLQSQVNNE